MAKKPEINLRITPESITKYCHEIMQGSTNTGRKHAAITALEGFIARHAGADGYTPVYEQVQEIIRNSAAETRSRLLSENGAALAPALRQQNRSEIARVYGSVSRNGFEQVLLEAVQHLTEQDRQYIVEWVGDWCLSSETAARQASGYPDAMDFRKAGIEILEYTALSHINTLLL